MTKTKKSNPKSKSQLSLNSKITIGLVSGLVILFLVSAVMLLNTYLLHYYTTKVQKAYQVQLMSNELLTDLINAETGQRGFLLTGDKSYLDPYNQASTSFNKTIHSLNISTSSQKDKNLVNAIDVLADKKLSELQETIALRETKGFTTAQAVVLTGQGKAYMDTIRNNLTTLDNDEQEQIKSNINDSQDVSEATTITLIIGQTLSLTIVIFAIYAIRRDLAERKKTQDALATSQDRLQAIISNMAEGLVVADEKGNFTLFNAAAERILGLGMMKVSPKDWAKTYGNYLPDKTTPFPTEQFPLIRALHGEEVSDVEMYVKNETINRGRFISISGSPLRSSENTILGSIAVFNDITERKEAQTILFAEKAKADAMLNSIGDGVFAIDPNGKVILFNHAAERITGFTAKEVLHHSYSEFMTFFNAKNGSIADDFIKKALSGKRASMATDTALHQKDGAIIPVADSAAPIINLEGGIEGVVVVFRDITHEKELEHLKDEFVSIASHELRTPMGAIRAFTSMILGGDYGPVNKNLIEPLEDIRSSTLRLVDLVNDMLNAARIEAGRMKFELSTFAIDSALEDTIAILVPLAKEKGIKLTAKTPKKIIAQADLSKVKQVLTNLIGNSLKFTDKGTIRVSTAIEGKYIEVSVQDTGFGISAEDQAKLFQKFQQISSEQKGRPAGTGLGLYISREMIRKMGGELWIKESRPGEGSTFAFTLPLADSSIARRVQSQISNEATLHPDQK